jgi:hypothetical protein
VPVVGLGAFFFLVLSAPTESDGVGMVDLSMMD